jgi:hypothetical protein
MGQNTPHYQLAKLPPQKEKVETIELYQNMSILYYFELNMRMK